MRVLLLLEAEVKSIVWLCSMGVVGGGVCDAVGEGIAGVDGMRHWYAVQ